MGSWEGVGGEKRVQIFPEPKLVIQTFRMSLAISTRVEVCEMKQVGRV